MKIINLSIISGILLTACSPKTPEANLSEQVVYVKTENLAETKASVPVQTSGILSSKQISKLSFKTGGLISRLYVDEGAYVKKGQLLATLDMTEISAQVQQAGVAFDKADRDLKRVKNLYADTVATLEQLQNATSAYEAALENKNIAEFNLRYSRITAPANGRIVAKLAEESEMVGSGMPVFVFTGEGKNEWVVKTGVSDKDIVQIEKGDSAKISFDAYPNQIFEAIVKSVSGISDPMSGTFEVELAINQENNKFINGLVARVNIETRLNRMVTLVPPAALTEADGKKAYVFVIHPKENTARKIPVTIAYFEDTKIAVLEPLNKIGEVVTSGASYLEDGSKVNIVR
jgi:membrane fusion protein, multidrug efflux system